MPAKTCAASAICGTHFGDTNADTSITWWPALERRSTNAILSAVAIGVFSFCRPSRGPTSTTVTRPGACTLFELQEVHAGLHQFALHAMNGLDDPGARRPRSPGRPRRPAGPVRC
jgi:hypothetical protein